MPFWLSLWQSWPWLKWLLPVIWVALVGGIAFFWQLGSSGLIDETEPLFAEAARQMTVTGDWITPYFNGETRFDKPPLIYWCMAIAYHTIGVNEWAARLPSALAAIALTAFGFYVLRTFGTLDPNPNPNFSSLTPAPERDQSQRNPTSDPRWIAAWIGSGAIALNFQTIAWGRSGVSDMLLTACISGALFAFFCGYAQPHQPTTQRRWYLSLYIFAALAVLTKGPVGIVIPGMIIGAFLLYIGQFRAVLRELQLLWGSVVFLLLTVPWYVAVTMVHGRTYLDDFFGYHNVERFTKVVNNHSAPWYFYFLVVFVGFVPWSMYLPMAIARLQLWHRSHWQQQPRQAQLGLFAAIWFGVIFVFFTIATTKLPSYTLPLLPAASVLVALLWSDRLVRPLCSRGLFITHGINAVFLCVLAGAVFYSGQWLGDDPVMPELPQLVQEANILIVGGVIWAVGAIASGLLILTRRTPWIWGTNLVTFVAFFLLAVLPAVPLMDSQRQLPLRQIAQEIVQSSDETAEIVMVGFKKPTLVFYTQRPVQYIYGVNEAIAYLESQGKLRNITARWRPTSTDAFLVGQISELKALGSLNLPPQKYEIVQTSGVYQLVRFHLKVPRFEDA
ncbi:MAG: glycosyltransferase family 39 protein [Symploca sp. SIO2B6]|nr:glycosyltransferase family 39 protein [Symploca sp. SIO2B6]